MPPRWERYLDLQARNQAHLLREQALIRQGGVIRYHDILICALKTKAHNKAASPLSPTQQPPQAGFLVTDSVACATPCPTRPTDTNILECTARAQGSNAARKPSEGLILCRVLSDLSEPSWIACVAQLWPGHLVLIVSFKPRAEGKSFESSIRRAPSSRLHDARANARSIAKRPL